jgi:uncharacterized protein YndB with AHSA1/START domain
MLKKLLIGTAALVAVILGGGLLLPDAITVTRTVTIQAPPEAVWPLIATPRRWPAWSPWNARDPQMAITYSGPAMGTGAKWEWKSASQGDGSMLMTVGRPPRDVEFELTIVGMGPPSHGAFTIEPEGTGSRVAWTMTSEMGMGPLGGWFGLVFKPMLAKDFEAGLAGLKKLAESSARG